MVTDSRHKQSKAKNTLFVLLIVICNSGGNLLLAMGMVHSPSLLSIPMNHYVEAVLGNGFLVAGTALTAMSLFAQLSMYTWADLSYILPVTAGGYVVTAILSKFFLWEHISVSRWIGVSVISLGVFLVAETRPDTKHGQQIHRAKHRERAPR